MEKDYEYPYGDMQVHEALEDLGRRLKALEPKSAKTNPPSPLPGHGIVTGSSAPTTGAIDKPTL